MLSDLEAAWLAGFLDGEGSFQIKYQRASRDRHQTSTVASVSCSQAEPRLEALYWLKEKCGGSISSHSTEKRNPRHNRSLRWLASGAQAVAVCQAVLPHLRLKRRHAELILIHQATKLPSNIGCRKGMSPKSIRITPAISAMRAEHVAEISKLNKRGVDV